MSLDGTSTSSSGTNNSRNARKLPTAWHRSHCKEFIATGPSRWEKTMNAFIADYVWAKTNCGNERRLTLASYDLSIPRMTSLFCLPVNMLLHVIDETGISKLDISKLRKTFCILIRSLQISRTAKLILTYFMQNFYLDIQNQRSLLLYCPRV